MCFSLPPAADFQQDQTDDLSEPPSNALSETLDSVQLVPSLPNPNVSLSGETLTSDHSPPPATAMPLSAIAGDIYYGVFDKEEPLENPDPSPSFRIVDDDSSSPLTAVPLSSSNKDSGSCRFSGDAAGEEALGSDASGTAVAASRVGSGLWNLGNTCFLNAIVQCFTHTVPLVQGLRSCSHSSPCDALFGGGDRFCVICALREQVECSLASSALGRIFSPLRLVDNLSYFSSFFRRYQQEDAHEFMQCALDKLERCFIDLKNNNKSFEDDNLVEKVFGGRLISKLKCCNCGHFSDTYEPLIDLSLEIDHVDTLPCALESFTKVENIDDKFKCGSCNDEVAMEKQLMLDQTPSIAAFHLKRFKTDGTYVEKIDKHVNFPLELDLQPYIISNQSNNAPLKYDLYAVVVHIGFSSTSGHYFCFVRTAPDTWHKLDDSQVTVVSEEYVLSQEAYILFYARQGTPWFSSIMESQVSCLGPSALITSPKSVLDTVDGTYKSNPMISANIERSEVSEPKEFSEQQFNLSCQETLELHQVNDAGDASHDCQQIPSGQNQESVGLSGSKGTTHAQVPPWNYTILNDSPTFNRNSCTESGDPDKNKRSEEVADVAMVDSFHPLTPPSSPSPEAPDKGYCIPRDHLKSENRRSCKRSLNTQMTGSDLKRKEASRYVKRMHGSRRDALLGLMACSSEPPLSKKRKMDSSTCMKGSPHSAPPKSNHTSVMGRLTAGFSR